MTMRDLLAQLDTPGGHIVCCLILILLGAGLWAVGVPKSDDLILGATSVLFGSMRGRGGSGPEKDAALAVDSKSTTTVEKTETGTSL